MATVPRCDGIPIQGYAFYSYKKVVPTADGLNQPDLNSLIQTIIKYYPQIITKEIVNQVVYILPLGGYTKSIVTPKLIESIPINPLFALNYDKKTITLI